VKYAYFWSNADFLQGSEITSIAAAHDSVGGAVFNNNSENSGTVNGGAVFNNFSDNFDTVNDGATFNDDARNLNNGTVNGGAVFNDDADNGGTVNDGATFNDDARQLTIGTVNGGATFNDAACSEQATGFIFLGLCNRKFVAHPTDLPTCNGTAPDGCANSGDTCGCG
jgi:hypothetical protein